VSAPDEGLVGLAQRLADDVLFPRALETDAAPIVPVDRLDALADAGLYGLVGPRSAGGLEASAGTADAVAEALASGCLTTTFVWMQHHNAVVALARRAPAPMAAEWLEDLCAGRRRAGIAFAGLRRPGPPVLTAGRVGSSFELQGYAPWVTGWERIDAVHVAARDDAGDVVWLLVDAVESPTLRIEWLPLAAVAASATVTVHFESHQVDAGRLTFTEPFEEFSARDSLGLRRNGALALGVATRCARLLGGPQLLGPDSLRMEIDACRLALDDARPDAIAAARAAAAELALHAATWLVVAGGGRSVLGSEHAQRLAREALFLQVFGQTPAIKAAQLADLERMGARSARMQSSAN
jgi:alkylation response protein AidB-like acyl-CoA dehydrogenase